MIAGQTPDEIKKLHFADIACGSGSFLLGVYDVLLRSHTAWYNKNKTNRDKGLKAGCLQNDDDSLRLSLRQKGEILLNNVYGVDIDAQAVEVAQLSLYLKLLEDETPASTRSYQQSFRAALLPSLGHNIVCGNSLIDWDILDGKLFDREDELKLNPMSYSSTFPGVMKSGGFDVIVGNPPYVRIQGFPKNQIEYFLASYEAATKNFDIYVNFIERGYKLLKPHGLLGEIIPNKFIKTDYGIGLRAFISKESALERLVDFKASQVFGATTYTCLLFLKKTNQSESVAYTMAEAAPESLSSLEFIQVPISQISPSTWLFTDSTTAHLVEKINEKGPPLLDLPASMNRGSSSGNDEILMVEEGATDLEAGILRKPLFATDFSRYAFHPNSKWMIIFPYLLSSDSYQALTENELAKKYPKAYRYLLANKSDLTTRKQFKEWYAYSAPRSLAQHEKAHIAIPLLANRGMFTLIPEGYNEKICPMASGGFTISLSSKCKIKPAYLLGLLNSKLLFWKLEQDSSIFRGGWVTCTKQYFGTLPIRTINFSDAQDKARHDKMVNLVEQMLNAKQQLAAARNERDQSFYEHKCQHLDREIDRLVYELYDLTEEEIALVEG